MRSIPEIFDISILSISLWLFGHQTFQYKSLSLFPSQILVCATAFDIKYMPQTSIKGQVLADLVVGFTESPVEAEDEEHNSDGKQVKEISLQGPSS